MRGSVLIRGCRVPRRELNRAIDDAAEQVGQRFLPVQALLGADGSEGVDEFGVNDGTDVALALAWWHEQPFPFGKVATWQSGNTA